MNNNEGYTVRHIPAQEYRVCHGCKWLNIIAGLRGHDRVTNDYMCIHPDFKDEFHFYNHSAGRRIYYNHEGDCITPEWCPYLKKTLDEEYEDTNPPPWDVPIEPRSMEDFEEGGKQ